MGEKIAYSVAEAAALLGVSEGLVYRLIARGEFPAIPMGRRKLVPAVALDAYLAKAAS